MPLPDYYSRVNPDLLSLIPPDCKTVLEIGCGAGALCEAYRRVNPGVEWDGFDSNKAALEIARIKGVVTCNKDLNESLPAMDTCDYDVVICGDILEHLINPLNVLKWAVAHAAPGAQVLACIPNVGHWTVIRDLMSGKWEYQDEGLLDRTHLRFFTLASIREMFAQAGLQVFEICGRDICNEGFNAWMNRDDPQSSQEQQRQMRAYQYIVRAVKPKTQQSIIRAAVENTPWISPVPKPLHIHAITAEECCARPRIHEPFAALRTVPGVTCTAGPNYDKLAYVGDGAIVIQQRLRKLDMAHQRNMVNFRQFFVIAELDDEPTAIGVDPMALRAVHAVQVSTEPLAKIVRQYNPNVMVFENQIADLPPWDLDPDSPFQGIRASIFYGAQNRESDWAPIMPALNRIIRDHKLQFKVIHDRAFYDALETEEQFKSFTPFCDYATYRKILRRCDIALLPLELTMFNVAKSDLKFLECAAEGVTCLVSKTVSAGVEPSNRYIHVTDMAEVWGSSDCVDTFTPALNRLITDAMHRLRLAENAYAYVRDHRLLGQHFRARLDWYRDLLSSKEELDRQLFARVPELARHAPEVTHA